MLTSFVRQQAHTYYYDSTNSRIQLLDVPSTHTALAFAQLYFQASKLCHRSS